MIRELNLAGASRSIGRQHGEQVLELRPQIQVAMQARLAVLRRQDLDLSSQVDEIAQVWEQHAPATLDMLRGITEVLEFDWRDYFAYTIISYLTDRMDSTHGSAHVDQGCTTWAAGGTWTGDGSPIMAKNRDNPLDQRPLECLARVHPEHGYPYLCLTTAGAPGVASSGINGVGLAVADTYVASTDLGPGIGRCSVMMDLLEKCASVQEAIEYVGSHPHLGNGTVSLIDAQDSMVVFELAHSVQVAVRPEEGFVVSTNHFTAPETRALWVDREPPLLQGSSTERRRRVEEALREARGQVDIAWAQSLMAQHGTGLSAICRHPEIDPQGVTISSAILLPDRAGLHLAHGLPCKTPFRLYAVID